MADYNVHRMPSCDNLTSILIDATSYALIQVPKFALIQIRNGTGTFWNTVTSLQVHELDVSFTPSSESVIEQLAIDASLPKEEKVSRSFQ